MSHVFCLCNSPEMDSPSHSQLLACTLQLEQQQEREQQQQQQEEENEQYVMDNNLHGGEHSNLSFNLKFILRYLSILAVASLSVRLYYGVTTDKKDRP